MKKNIQLKEEIEKYKDNVIIVEGKNDIASLRALGFHKVYAIHQNKISVQESIESITEKLIKSDRACILTDLDKSGRKFHAKVKQILQEKGVKTSPSLRKLLIKSGISHVEGLYSFIENN